MKCPNCNNDLNEIFKENSKGFECLNCDYGVSAFASEPIDEDEMIYKI